jgi:hypothetical protein
MASASICDAGKVKNGSRMMAKRESGATVD